MSPQSRLCILTIAWVVSTGYDTSFVMIINCINWVCWYEQLVSACSLNVAWFCQRSKLGYPADSTNKLHTAMIYNISPIYQIPIPITINNTLYIMPIPQWVTAMIYKVPPVYMKYQKQCLYDWCNVSKHHITCNIGIKPISNAKLAYQYLHQYTIYTLN